MGVCHKHGKYQDSTVPGCHQCEWEKYQAQGVPVVSLSQYEEVYSLLMEYGRHGPACPQPHDPVRPCDCGWDEARAALSGPGAKSLPERPRVVWAAAKLAGFSYGLFVGLLIGVPVGVLATLIVSWLG